MTSRKFVFLLQVVGVGRDQLGVEEDGIQLWYQHSLKNTNSFSYTTFEQVQGSWENFYTNSCLSTLITSHTNSPLSTLINSHATLVLVWPGQESWENSSTNSRLSTLMQLLFSFDQHNKIKQTTNILLRMLHLTPNCNNICSECSSHQKHFRRTKVFWNFIITAE